MRLALAHGNCCTGRDIQSYIANDDVQRPLQDEEMLVLVLVNVYRHTIARIRDYLKHGIDTLCLLGRGADRETLARRRFQPFTIVLMIDRYFLRFLRGSHIHLPASNKLSGLFGSLIAALT